MQLRRAWLLMQMVTISFPPSNNMNKHVSSFLTHWVEFAGHITLDRNERASRNIPEVCTEQLKHTKLNGARKLPISRTEYLAIVSDVRV